MSRPSRARRKRTESAQPLRVLHVINGLGPGGAETVLYRLATHPSDVVHEIISLEERDWYSDQLEAAGIAVHHINWSIPTAPIAALRLHRLLRASRADLVQAWMYRSNLLAGLSGRVAGKPVVWNIRCSSLEPLRFSSRAVARLGGVLARWVPQFVINCSSQSVSIHDRLGYGAAEGAVIPNGYDPEILTMDEKARSRTRRALGLRAGTFVIGTVGRWHVQKGIPLLLHAVRLLRERGIPVRLVLAGRGLDAENPELAKIIQESGCSDQVERLGQRRDIPDIARALDLHVLASIGSEGFPNVVAETMLAGTPNVATDVGDAAHIVGDTGWVVGPGQADALADAIGAAHEEWASSPAQWQRRRKAARQRIVDNFSLESMATAYEKVWRQVVRSAA